MARLEWDEAGSKLWETGLDRGVLYPLAANGTYDNGVSWEGLTSVNEQPSGSEPQKFYADNITYANILSIEEFAATIEAYTYPDEFASCDGSAAISDGIYIGQQSRQKFGFCYRTKIGNDVSEDLGYKIHIIYNCLAAPSDKNYETVNDSPELIQFSWEVSTDPVKVTGHKPTATLVIDSTKVSAANLKILEDTLYGIDAAAFDATKTYAVGDYVTYQSKTYKCTTAVATAGEWDSSDWTEVENPNAKLPLPDEIAAIITAG